MLAVEVCVSTAFVPLSTGKPYLGGSVLGGTFAGRKLAFPFPGVWTQAIVACTVATHAVRLLRSSLVVLLMRASGVRRLILIFGSTLSSGGRWIRLRARARCSGGVEMFP